MPKRDRMPLHDIHGSPSARFTTTPWDAEGVATLEASGSDVRSALEAGLRAVLKISTDGEPDVAASDRSIPLQGEGEDLAELFLDLIEDFLDQMAFSPFAYHDVVIDGVLHRDGGGYVAWGFAAESTALPPRTELPYWHKMPTVESGFHGIVFRASLARS
jgi:hypothetical protein